MPFLPLFLQHCIVFLAEFDLWYQKPSSNERERVQRRRNNENDFEAFRVGRCELRTYGIGAVLAVRIAKEVRRVE